MRGRSPSRSRHWLRLVWLVAVLPWLGWTFLHWTRTEWGRGDRLAGGLWLVVGWCGGVAALRVGQVLGSTAEGSYRIGLLVLERNKGRWWWGWGWERAQSSLARDLECVLRGWTSCLFFAGLLTVSAGLGLWRTWYHSIVMLHLGIYFALFVDLAVTAFQSNMRKPLVER